MSSKSQTRRGAAPPQTQERGLRRSIDRRPYLASDDIFWDMVHAIATDKTLFNRNHIPHMTSTTHVPSRAEDKQSDRPGTKLVAPSGSATLTSSCVEMGAMRRKSFDQRHGTCSPHSHLGNCSCQIKKRKPHATSPNNSLESPDRSPKVDHTIVKHEHVERRTEKRVAALAIAG
jgi:hypothetical protein